MNGSLIVGATTSDFMTSLQIAEITGKEHKNVLADIRNLIDQMDEIGRLNFQPSYYLNTQNKRQPMYELTKKGCLCLASGYDAGLRMKIIDRWDILERERQKQLPQSFAEALRLAADQAERIEHQQKLLTEQAPKVLFAKSVESSKQSCLVKNMSVILKQNGVEIGQNRLFQWLRDNHYLGAKGEYYNIPTQKSMDMGLFELKEQTVNKPDGTVLVTTTTKVTGKGQVYFVNKFLNHES